MNRPFDRLHRLRHADYLRASEDDRQRFNFHQFIEERRNYIERSRITPIAGEQRYGRPSLLGDYPGDPEYLPPIKKPRSRSVGRHPYYLDNQSNFNASNQIKSSTDDNDLNVDEIQNDKSVGADSNTDKTNDKETTNKEKLKIVYDDNKTSQNSQKDSSHALPPRKVVLSDSSFKISAVLNNLPNSTPKKVNQATEPLMIDSFNKFYGESITDIETTVESKFVKLPILEWSCDGYNYNSIPEYNQNNIVGGDGISIELFYMCKYCKMFTNGLQIMHHLKSKYHYDRYKEYLRTGMVLSSSESDGEWESGAKFSPEKVLNNKNLTNNLEMKEEADNASEKSEIILDIHESEDLLKLPDVGGNSSSNPKAKNRSRSRNKNKRKPRFNQQRNDNYRNQQNWRRSRKSDFDARRSRFSESQSSRSENSFRAPNRERYGKGNSLFDNESRFDDVSLKAQFEMMKSRLNAGEFQRWQTEKRLERRDIDDNLYNVHQELDFD